MPPLLRHMVAIAALPFTVTVLVPAWIERAGHLSPAVGATAGAVLAQGAGAALLAAGVVLVFATARRFATEGKGTLAPWDPPREFVASGPYRHVRNPMIAGIFLILFGEALVLQSRPQAVWAACVVAVNLIYIPAVEEPQLARRFGEPYRVYRGHVRRFIPRFTPWRPEPRGAGSPGGKEGAP
jgi:protein-S-isoprenylcysteine O-methyltransferase Ste14